MIKILITISFTLLLFSCGDKSSNTVGKNEEKKSNIIDISKYNEAELYNYIVELESNLLDTANNMLVPNKENSIRLLESSNKFAERFPNNSEKRNVIYKGVRAARGLQKYHEAVRLLDKIIKEYPDDDKTVEILFEKAFLQDENLKNTEEARRIYTSIAEKYPEHQFGKDSKARLITIHMTDEEFTKWLIEQNAE
jgi:tetratricopeptide (TPR) repeat protein